MYHGHHAAWCRGCPRITVIEAFRADVRGQLLTPADAEYDAAGAFGMP